MRVEALARVAESSLPIVKVAAELGVDHRTLWKWVNDERLEVIDPRQELTLAHRNKIRDLEKANALLRRDLDFEKKAGAFNWTPDPDDRSS